MDTGTQKDKKFEVRVTETQKDLLLRAAELRHSSLSDFVRSIALDAAEMILSDQTHFTMSENQWKAFCRELDRPAKILPRLREFMSKPSVFDDE